MAKAPLYPSGTVKRSRTDGHEHTINGLLTKRADLYNEAERLRDRTAEIRNDVDAIDRVLRTLDFTGDLNALMPRQKHTVLFGKGELTGALIRELRAADGPLGSRELASSIISLRGEDARDRRMLTEITRRASKALRILRDKGHVRSFDDERGNMRWEWRHPSS
jgi:hypothetical protein